MTKRSPQPSDTRSPSAQPPVWRQVTPHPPRRRLWLLIASASAVVLWNVFLAWMAWWS